MRLLANGNSGAEDGKPGLFKDGRGEVFPKPFLCLSCRGFDSI